MAENRDPDNVGKIVPTGNHFPGNPPEYPQPERDPDGSAHNFEHISLPIRRVLARALLNARLREFQRGRS